MNEYKKDCCSSESCECAVEKSIAEMECPLESQIAKWNQAFYRAMGEVSVEILKEKIRANWGECLDKQADAVIEAMGAQWQGILLQAKAQCNLRENMKAAFSGCCEKAEA